MQARVVVGVVSWDVRVGGKEAEEQGGMAEQSAPGGNSGRLPVPPPHCSPPPPSTRHPTELGSVASCRTCLAFPGWALSPLTTQQPALTLTRAPGKGSKPGAAASVWAVLWPQMLLRWAVGCLERTGPRREARQPRTAPLPPEAPGPVTLDAPTAPAGPPAGIAAGSALRPC